MYFAKRYVRYDQLRIGFAAYIYIYIYVNHTYICKSLYFSTNTESPVRFIGICCKHPGYNSKILVINHAFSLFFYFDFILSDDILSGWSNVVSIAK